MQYMLMIYEDESLYGNAGKVGPALQEIVARHMAFNRDLGAVRVAGAGLKGTATATTVRTTQGSKTVHDGPFAESKEQLGGYYLIDVPDLDAALGWASRCPGAAHGAIEVRPLWKP